MTGTPIALLTINSPFAHGRISALARVVELKPVARDSAASEVPFFMQRRDDIGFVPVLLKGQEMGLCESVTNISL